MARQGAGVSALGLYRQLQRAVRHFPEQGARKQLSANVRDLFLVRRDVKDPKRVEALLRDAQHDLHVLRRFALLNSATVDSILRLSHFAHTTRDDDDDGPTA